MGNFWGTVRSDRRKTDIGTGGRSTDLVLATETKSFNSMNVVKVAGWSYDEPIEGYKTKFNKFTYYRTTTVLDSDHIIETLVTLLNKEFHHSRTELIEVSTGIRKEINPLDVLGVLTND